VHRNTLRYRLKRITDIAGLDLGEPDVQFNLQLATRAWRTLAALRLLGTMTAREKPTAVTERFWEHDVPADVS
jgi:PucR C-terminal helix-turn-helix domain